MNKRVIFIVILFMGAIPKTPLAQVDWTKYDQNPVLGPNILGEWDSLYTLQPWVILDGQTYRMWYTGFNGFTFQIGYAESSDGIHWNKHAANPVLSLGSAGEFDDTFIRKSTVILDNGVYKMWYGGYDGTHWRIGYATSLDGINWTKYENNSVLDIGNAGDWDDSGVKDPCVIVEGSVFRMWYSGAKNGDPRGSIGYATSEDGIHWDKYYGNPVLVPGEPEEWNYSIGDPCVIFDSLNYKMWYIGRHEQNYQYSIGYAISEDGINWSKYEKNPVLENGQPGAWDDFAVAGPCVVFNNNIYKMWYSGDQFYYGHNWAIGYATAVHTLPEARNSISGNVTDFNTGEGIPGAVIKYTGPFSGQTVADDVGSYRIAYLTDGQYLLQASANGYRESDPVTVTVPPDAIVDFSLKSPDIDVVPDSFLVELEAGQKTTQILTISNSGSDTLIFQVSQTPWQSGAHRQGILKTSKQTSQLPTGSYPGRFLKTIQTMESSSSGPTLNVPMASVIPIMDGEYTQGEWEDAVTVSATPIHYPQGQEVGKVYIKNTLENLYVLIDYHSGSVYNKTITGDIWLDLDNNGTIDGGFYTDLSSGVAVTYFDFPAQVAVGPSTSPDNPSPHWIFEYAIPLSGLGKVAGDVFGIHFVLYDFSWGDGGEWFNAGSEFDFGHPDRWGKLSLTFQASWLSIEPTSGILSPGESLPVAINFDATTLSDGVYRVAIKIKSNDPNEGEILIPVQLTVDPSAYTEEKTLELPDVFAISQNYPNPFNGETRIRYQLPERSRVGIKIYDLLGREVRTLVETQKNRGYYEVIWRGRDDWGREVGSGVYVCRFKAGDFVRSRKIVLMK